ncbi:maltokinase [Streptomyces sp. NPDC058755]|uniref:maltokinase N-terminal cap-like domain-containing protein n=1 Tax=Streptomyces sp. NPDC058755 TaxID=3346624 RepID=UPI0036900D75
MRALPDPVLDLTRIRAALDALLPAWLPGRRWYAGKGAGSPPDVTTRLLDVVLPGDPALLVAVFDAGADGPYQALIGVRRDPPPPSAEPVIGRLRTPGGSGVILYEATLDPELMGRLLVRVAAGGRSGPVCFEPVPGVELPVGAPGVASTAEQSNTSVAFAQRAMLKVLRRPVPGTSPELELLTALQRAGDVPSAALLAHVRTSAGSAVGAHTLALLQQFVRSRGDGWTIAVDRARACMAGECEAVPPHGGFAAEAYALGLATARVHTALAEQLGSRPLTRKESEALLDLLADRLAEGLRAVPQLAPFARALWAVQDDLREIVGRGGAPHVQRIHGDLHLGQALRGEQGWILVDFEGEPGHSPEERRRPQPALRDVAAMLRSFDYAAHHALSAVLDRPPGDSASHDPRGVRPARRASAWAVHNRRAYATGYADGGGQDPRCSPVLLRCFEADKAVYEAVYESRNRPEWLPIPLSAVRRLAQWRRSSAAADTASGQPS